MFSSQVLSLSVFLFVILSISSTSADTTSSSSGLLDVTGRLCNDASKTLRAKAASCKDEPYCALLKSFMEKNPPGTVCGNAALKDYIKDLASCLLKQDIDCAKKVVEEMNAKTVNKKA